MVCNIMCCIGWSVTLGVVLGGIGWSVTLGVVLGGV